ncbi:response regulator [Thaumasiovibrio subtropicus]|uniref:response regulator n=1 Tax=Thaumasiovibrio subtropicus TaxID=1891207 RepID=UPI000B35A471|nr:response regulator transcription factor [Thaumasiovibrio subtropicus]
MWQVLIVDDHPLLRKGLRQLLNAEPDFEVCGDLASGDEAMQFTQPYDLVLLDLNMRGLNGLETLKKIKDINPTTWVVILTVSDDASDIRQIVQAGADGYLLKDDNPDDMITQLRQLMTHGNHAYSASVKAQLTDILNAHPQLPELTKRETEVLRFVAEGFRNKEIADKLFISESTVKVHVKSVLKKLNAPSRVAATLLYLESQK